MKASRPDYSIRLIQSHDNAHVAKVIRDVMTEFGAVGQGYSIEDPEVDSMYDAYAGGRSCYYVITRGDEVVGCGGIAPLAGGDPVTCELKKMYFLPSTRGLGLGRRLLMLLLDEARRLGFQQCYIETLDRMSSANQLYQRNGFELIDRPLGRTGHCGCDRWYLLNL